MKFVISHQGCKREINGAFSICASDADFDHLTACLKRMEGIYGWIDVPEQVLVKSNTAPIDWLSSV